MSAPAARRLVVVALLGAISLPACSSHDRGGGPPSIAAQPELAKLDWMRHTRRTLRHEACEPKSGLRRCSDLDRDECELRMHGALAACDEQIASGLPEVVVAGIADATARAQLTGCMWHRAAVELGPIRVDMLCLLKSATHRGS